VLPLTVIQFGVLVGLVGLIAWTFRRSGRPAPRVLPLGAGAVGLLCNLGSQLYCTGTPAQSP